MVLFFLHTPAPPRDSAALKYYRHFSVIPGMTSKTELKYVPGLDGLRGLACLSVVLFHTDIVTKSHSALTPFKGGTYGVDLFFVLSGFLITSILLNEYEKYSSFNFISFYIKRLLRLYPPILISIVVFLLPLFITDRTTAIANIVCLMTYTGDCFMVVQHFTHLPYAKLSGHTWSLAVEEQFYLTFPFLLLLVLRAYSRKKQSNFISFYPTFLLLYIFVVVICSILLGEWFYKFFLWRFFEIYLGTFVAMIYSRSYERFTAETAFSNSVRTIVQQVCSNKIVLLTSILCSVCLIVYPAVFPGFLVKYNLLYVVFTLAASVLIVNAVYPINRYYSGFISNKALVSIGKFSYGLYLYTPFIARKVNSVFFDDPFRNAKTMLICDVIAVSVSLAFSYLSFTIIEKNILKLRHRISFPQKQVAAA
jgi:peptidoglycan/LPS O-acetylase OafA/YrhL